MEPKETISEPGQPQTIRALRNMCQTGLRPPSATAASVEDRLKQTGQRPQNP